MALYIVLFIVGVILLSFSSDVLIDNSVLLGLRLNIRPSVIGMTIIAFGTSLPEFVVSFQAVLKDTIEIAFGNVVGSNISNIGLVIGLSAILIPLQVDKDTHKKEIPFIIIASIVFYFLCINLYISILEGIIMLAVFFSFIFITMKNFNSNIEVDEISEEQKNAKDQSLLKIIILIIAGLAGVIYGSRLALNNAVNIAEALGISQVIIGLSVIAIGTSLPELATSIAAILKNKPDIAIGNIVGSNMFNIFFILGFSVLFKPLNIEIRSLIFEIPLMILFTSFIFIVSRKNLTINRRNGFALLYGFIIYVVVLFF